MQLNSSRKESRDMDGVIVKYGYKQNDIMIETADNLDYLPINVYTITVKFNKGLLYSIDLLPLGASVLNVRASDFCCKTDLQIMYNNIVPNVQSMLIQCNSGYRLSNLPYCISRITLLYGIQNLCALRLKSGNTVTLYNDSVLQNINYITVDKYIGNLVTLKPFNMDFSKIAKLVINYEYMKYADYFSYKVGLIVIKVNWYVSGIIKLHLDDNLPVSVSTMLLASDNEYIDANVRNICGHLLTTKNVRYKKISDEQYHMYMRS